MVKWKVVTRQFSVLTKTCNYIFLEENSLRSIKLIYIRMITLQPGRMGRNRWTIGHQPCPFLPLLLMPSLAFSPIFSRHFFPENCILEMQTYEVIQQNTKVAFTSSKVSDYSGMLECCQVEIIVTAKRIVVWVVTMMGINSESVPSAIL